MKIIDELKYLKMRICKAGKTALTSIKTAFKDFAFSTNFNVKYHGGILLGKIRSAMQNLATSIKVSWRIFKHNLFKKLAEFETTMFACDDK